MAEKLGDYRRKRDFGATPEPAGDRDSAADGGRYVIQQHSARRLHWDLRLEHDGALASWALPRGVPMSPDENRKAVRTEDHPLEYLDFHGEIPKGQYGAGTMTIWDRGTFELHKWRDREVIVTLHGDAVSGRYALFQAGKDPKDWLIHRMDPPADPDAEPMPEHLVPMLARPAELPRDDERWGYEIKWDGVRAIAYSQPGRLRFESRNLNDVTERYPELRPLNRALGSRSAVLDGEIVAFDDDGRPSFGALQGRMHLQSETQIRRRARDAPVTYVIFDLLYLDGRSLMRQPYEERRARLEELELKGDSWQTPAWHRGQGARLLEASGRQGLEGIVAKRLDSAYEPGRRGGTWLKVKNSSRQELVVGGWLPGEGRRRDRLGALLVGYHEGGELRFAGKVGTGFGERELARLGELLAPLERPDSPFAGGRPEKGARFVEPRLVAEVEFTEWTSQGVLRHPSYKGLRDDCDPLEVVRERREEPVAAGAALALPAKSGTLTVEGEEVKLSGLDRPAIRGSRFTRAELLDYYARVAPTLIPHVRDRAAGGGTQIGGLPALLRWANQDGLGLEVSLAPAARPERPGAVAFELAPGPGVDAVECARIALLLRDVFERLSIESFVKASGAGGVDVLLPLAGEASWDQTGQFAASVAELLEGRLPERVAVAAKGARRKGRVLVDVSANARDGGAPAPYGLRAWDGEPAVSLPLAWDEVEAAAAGGDSGPFRAAPAQALERVERLGDLWAPALSLAQELPAI